MNTKYVRMIGFSALEVLISITLSLILLIGVLQIFLNGRSNYALEDGYTQLQENGRFIESYIVRVIRLAGYRSPPSTVSNFTAISSIFTTALPYISGTNSTGVNGSDTLTIRYQGSGNGTGTPDGTIVDCLNVPADSNTLVTNIFSLTSSYQLQCQSLNANAPIPNNTQVLISGVENFQVLYGEDVNNDKTADRYVPANYAFLNWNDVVSIRLSVILRSANPVNPFVQNPTFYMLGTLYTPSAPDQYLRNQVTFTVSLRNLLTQTH